MSAENPTLPPEVPSRGRPSLSMLLRMSLFVVHFPHPIKAWFSLLLWPRVLLQSPLATRLPLPSQQTAQQARANLVSITALSTELPESSACAVLVSRDSSEALASESFLLPGPACWLYTVREPQVAE